MEMVYCNFCMKKFVNYKNLKIDGENVCDKCYQKNNGCYIITNNTSDLTQWKKGITWYPLEFSKDKMKKFKSLKNILKLLKGDNLTRILFIDPNNVQSKSVKLTFNQGTSLWNNNDKIKNLHIRVYPTSKNPKYQIYISNGFTPCDPFKKNEVWYSERDCDDYPELITKDMIKYCKMFYHTIMKIYLNAIHEY